MDSTDNIFSGENFQWCYEDIPLLQHIEGLSSHCFDENTSVTAQNDNVEFYQELPSSEVVDYIDYEMLAPNPTHENIPEDRSYDSMKPELETSNVFVAPELCTDKWPGILNFNLEVASEMNPPFVFSSKLNKLFIGMGNVVPIRFKWQQSESNLFIRALPVYVAQNHRNIPVVRCRTHADQSDPSNKDFQFVHHVLRCEDENSIYVEEHVSNFLSVVVPAGVPEPGTDFVKLVYKLVCKSSCKDGMNRQPIQVCFTLERKNGEVIGRDVLGIRICSCPKRDMKREEELAVEGTNRKRRSTNKDKKIQGKQQINMVEVPGFIDVKNFTSLMLFTTIGKSKRLKKDLDSSQAKIVEKWKKLVDRDSD